MSAEAELVPSGLFDLDAETAFAAAASMMPDLVAALDRVGPTLFDGDRSLIRRFVDYIDAACQVLSEQAAASGWPLPPQRVIRTVLADGAIRLPWFAPTLDGRGLLSVLVDRVRGLGGFDSARLTVRDDIDPDRFDFFVKTVHEVERERALASPLRRAMQLLELSSAEVAGIMGVRRQAVDKWLLAGPPTDRLTKIGALAEVAETLAYRLRDGLPAVVARRPAEAYGGRTMLQLIAADEHEWLRRSVAESFDFRRVA